MASPIENMLVGAIIDVAKQDSIRLRVYSGNRIIACTPPGRGLILWAQLNEPILGYKIDILLSVDGCHQLAVECDGHEWHERTQQQASYDRARDRALFRAGTPVIRFTGSDIHRDSNQCAREAILTLNQWAQMHSDDDPDGDALPLFGNGFPISDEVRP